MASPKIVEVDAGYPEAAADAVAEAGLRLRAGELVILPTETVPGIAGRPDHADATQRLFDAKKRPRGLNLPVLAFDETSALGLGRESDDAKALARAFWPGPLTLVLPRSEASKKWALGDDPATIGLRVPAHAIALALLRAAGPLAVSSANLSGRPPARTGEELVETFGSAVAIYLVEVATSGDEASRRAPSTVIDLSGSSARVMRVGSIKISAIQDVLGVSSPQAERLDFAP